MQEKKLTDIQIALLIKNALEFNANMIAFASRAYGNVNDYKQDKKVAGVFISMSESYTKSIDEVLGL